MSSVKIVNTGAILLDDLTAKAKQLRNDNILIKEDLIAFEEEMARVFGTGKIRAPVHLVGGNENQLLGIFQNIKDEDWVFSTHRSHLHALLKGVPPEVVREDILAGKSICLQYSEYRFHTSAIVGGNLPQAVGVAMTGQRVWVFCGEMAAQTGIFSECLRFSEKNDLPITFVIEDSGFSVLTPTSEVWPDICLDSHKVIRYQYKNTFPHQGTGVQVAF